MMVKMQFSFSGVFYDDFYEYQGLNISNRGYMVSLVNILQLTHYNNIASSYIKGVLFTGLPLLESPGSQLSKNAIIFGPPCTV